MRLESLLKNIDHKIVSGSADTEIKSVRYDSRKVEKGDLFVGTVVVRELLDVVGADAEVEQVACTGFVACVSVVEVFPSAHHISDGITRERVGLDAGALGLQHLGDDRLLGSVVGCFHIG